MSTRFLLIAAALLLFCSGCAQTRLAAKPLLAPSQGELFLYCEPLSQEAAKLHFAVTDVAAIRDDGLTVSLTLAFKEFAQADLRRQRLFAQGIVPAGRYVGLAFTVKHAELSGETGAMRLLVQDRPTEVKIDASVRDGKAAVVTLNLNYRESVKGVEFSPAFMAEIPLKPLPGLSGYVTNRGDNTITVFDRRSARVGGVVETGPGPSGIALDQTLMRAYVALSGQNVLAVFDVKENDFTDRIRLNPGDEPSFVGLSADGKTAVTANTGSNSASIIDIQALSEVARLPTGIGPEFLIMDRSGRRAFVFNRLSNSITVIDLATRQVAATIPTESAPVYGQFNRKGDRLYVAHGMTPNILEISLDTLSITRRINAGSGVSALKVNSATDLLYVATRFGGIIDVYDPSSLMPVNFLRADGGVNYMTIDGEENNLLALHPRNRLIRLINLVSKKERGVVDTGADPYCAVIFGERL
ncbi:YncE family protein [Geomonas agri]|uniref:YncE family protein n=1 Tax=Geomonas agri TaxID=2873702 RepID=UPI001CD475D9|nr:YncE family protein [Geomonas agri]